MGEMERRKALVFVMAIVLVVLAAMTFILTTTISGEDADPNHAESIAFAQVSSLSWATGVITWF